MRYSFFFVLLFLCCNMNAKNVSVTKAHETAELFFVGNKTRSASPVLRYLYDNRVMSGTNQTRSNSDPLFYVFAGTDNKGFVFVSAEDQVMPILAYSFSDKAPQIDDLPESLIDWINTISNQIEYVRANGIKNNSANALWANTRSGNSVIELETAKWNQHNPYNNQCPLDGSERSVVGCVPVATAIVMRYHKWPQSGKGYTDSYRTQTKGIYVASRNLNHDYKWDNMPLVYTNNGYSNEEADEVSTLMADIGAAFRADFTKESTSTYLNITKLYEHFGYNPAMKNVQREYYSDEKWLTMLKDEIYSLRPVLYSGRGNSGHRFVLDGFTDDDYFHVNWGWGGISNGYYTLSNLVPDNRGGYNDAQSACFNVKPNTSSEVEDWIKFKSPGIELFQTTFETNKRYYFDRLTFSNNTVVDFSGTFCGAVTNRNGEIKEWVTNELNYTLKGGGRYMCYRIGFTIKNKINIGDRIRFFYKSNDSEDWHLITSLEENCQWEMLIADEYYISECTSFTFDKGSRIITLETKDGVNVKLYTSSSEYITTGLSHNANIIYIDTKQLSSGEYTIRLQKGEDVKELMFSVKSL